MLTETQKLVNLNWLKSMMMISTTNVSTNGLLTFLDGKCYGNTQTINNWKTLIPRSFWSMLIEK